MMARRNHDHPGPGKARRKGISIVQLIRLFPTISPRRIGLPRFAGRTDLPALRIHERPVRGAASEHELSLKCRKFFSVRTGTVMQEPRRAEMVIAAYMLTTNLKGDSSMKLHRDLDITQKSAWHLAHRIRETWDRGEGLFGGPIEVDRPTWAASARTCRIMSART